MVVSLDGLVRDGADERLEGVALLHRQPATSTGLKTSDIDIETFSTTTTSY